MSTDRSRAWPELDYEAFVPTLRLLHRGLQTVGKLTLLRPLEPHWANVVLLPASRGLTTGPIPWHDQVFTVDVDFFAHEQEHAVVIACDAIDPDVVVCDDDPV